MDPSISGQVTKGGIGGASALMAPFHHIRSSRSPIESGYDHCSMSNLRGIGLGSPRGLRRDDKGVEYVATQHPLRRVLAFRRRTIDQVVNCPIVKSEIFGYFKLQKQLKRVSETIDLERQWNPLG